MFTGLIEQQGKVLENYPTQHANRIVLSNPWENLQIGESIAVNGVCLTLLPSNTNELLFDVSPETLRLTALAQLRPGDCVNLERAMLANSRFGGHYVSGHVDTTASIKKITPIGEFIEITVGEFAVCATMYTLPKGSITLDGVSLTINAVEGERITVMLVPHTLANTTLSRLQVSQRINVEFDYMARIVAHQLSLYTEELKRFKT